MLRKPGKIDHMLSVDTLVTNNLLYQYDYS